MVWVPTADSRQSLVKEVVMVECNAAATLVIAVLRELLQFRAIDFPCAGFMEPVEKRSLQFLKEKPVLVRRVV